MVYAVKHQIILKLFYFGKKIHHFTKDKPKIMDNFASGITSYIFKNEKNDKPP